MIGPRRQVLRAGLGGALIGLAAPALLRAAPESVEIAMSGRDFGAAVWFDPIGLRVEPGTEIRWTNRDAGNVHTATAYHPSLFGRRRRIPSGAEPWDSDFLAENETFVVTLRAPGVYDYYCQPHEHAGMIGRIVVGDGELDWLSENAGEPPAEAALARFPPVADIVANGVVRGG